VYTVPLRQTRLAAELKTTIVRSVQHYHDDYRSIMGRILRLSGKVPGRKILLRVPDVW